MNAPVTQPGRPRRQPQSGMSYKFQRLREKVRRAVQNGELSGKLPGERALARRFHVNAKTLSKALTDLAAEGVLDRSIGRGTYVKGTAPASTPATGRWLVLCDPEDENCCTVEHLRRLNPDLNTVSPLLPIRPSLLSQFAAVIDLSASTPESLARDLLVRNMPLVSVNREPRSYSTHAVAVDVPLGVARLGRDLLLAGHRRLGVTESRGGASILQTLRHAAARYATDATIDAADPSEAATLVEHGVTAIVCGSAREARQAAAALATAGIDVPSGVSLVAVGCACPSAGCSGYLVDCHHIAETIVSLLRDSPVRPVTLWLAGAWTDRATLAPTGAGPPLRETASLRVSGMPV